MTRRSGQITAWEGLLGIAVVVVVIAAMIALMDLLLPPQDPETVRLAQDIAGERQATALEQPVPGVLVCPPTADRDRTVSSTLLYECPQLYDGLVITYTGEVVGEVLQRGDQAWVQLNDDAYAQSLGPLGSHGVAAGANSGVGVRIPIDAARRIRNVGANERQGDLVTVRGVFDRADPRDGGGTVIRAERVLEIQPGGERPALDYPGRRLAAVILLPITLVVTMLAFREQLADRVPLIRRRRFTDD